MTTVTVTNPINHTNDAGFRAWATDISTSFSAAGLIQTADTGQINLVTATRPGTNTSGGYEIWRFDDTQQGTSPVFFRIEYGTGSSASSPRIQVIIGTSSNGSGTIGGTTTGSLLTVTGGTPISSVTLYTTRVCVAEGFMGLMFGLGSINPGPAGFGFFAICRSVDSNGDPTPDAAQIYAGGSGSISSRVLRYSDAIVYVNVTGSHCLVHGGPTSSLVAGANAQVYKHYMTLPRVRPHPYLLTVIAAELGNNTQFTATPVGATSRTFVSGGSEGFLSGGVAIPASSSYTLAMLWE